MKTPHALSQRFAPAAGLLAALALSGCIRPDIDKTLSYNDAEHQPFMARGDASIKGEGFIRRPNSVVALCSGGNVFLFPDTPYYRENAEILRNGGRPTRTPELEEAQKKSMRRTQCNQNGRFEFNHLPKGKWFLLTRVTYESPFDTWSSDSVFLTEAETRAGEVTKVILSDPNRI